MPILYKYEIPCHWVFKLSSVNTMRSAIEWGTSTITQKECVQSGS